MYARLAKAMNMSREECHFALFDLEECRRAQSIINTWAWEGDEDEVDECW